jgi:hypothetical protein
MTGDDVHRNGMDGPFEFDDEAAEALLGGRGAGIDPTLADLVGEIRTNFSTATPAVGPELAAFFREEPQRFVRSRAGLAAKVAAAIAACLAAMSGLAVAGALPGPLQHAVSRAAGDLGVHVPDNDGHGSSEPRVIVGVSESTTTNAGTSTTEPGHSRTPPAGTHGAAVSAVAHDRSLTGCEHGAAVASVASGTTKTPACVKSSSTTTTTTTSDSAPVTTTTQPGHGHSPPTTRGNNAHGSEVVPPPGHSSRNGTGG